MSKEEHNYYKKEREYTKGPAPPIKPKKYIKYRIIHNNNYKKIKTYAPQNSTLQNVNKNKDIKIKLFENFAPLPSNDDWSIFSPNFINNYKEDNYIPNPYYKDKNMVKQEKIHNKISKSMLNYSQNDNEKIINLEKEINGLKKTNQNLLDLIMEKEKENRLLINNIDKLKIESIDKLSNYLNYIEELGKKFKFSNDEDEDIYLDITNNPNETNEINIELNKNKQLKKILAKKNEEFNDINDAIKKLIFNENSPLLKESKLNLQINDKNNNNQNKISINEDKNEENEIINIKNEYHKLKNDYGKLLDKYKKNEEKNKGSKNRIKFVYKDIPQNLKQKYELQIKDIIDENKKIKGEYSKEIEELNFDIASLKVEFLNKQFEKETKLLNIKKKITQMIKICKETGIKLNNEIFN